MVLDECIGEKADGVGVAGLDRDQVLQGVSGLAEQPLLLVQQRQILPAICGVWVPLGELLQACDRGGVQALAPLAVGPLQPAPQVIRCLTHRLGKGRLCLGEATGAVSDAALLEGSRCLLASSGW